MAASAVRQARRIAVVAAVESTIEPTMSLLREEAVSAGADVEIESLPCFDAWPLFERGDLDGYHRFIAAHVDAIDDVVRLVVLAQATMAPAAALVADPDAVRSSPVAAVEAALALRAMTLNVLLITLDQFRGDCLSAAGHPLVRTPNLDALAARRRAARSVTTARPRRAARAGPASTRACTR